MSCLDEPSIKEVLKEGKGSCNSLTAVAAQTMRYFGIPTSIDECPVWAHRNSGHRWNAFLNEEHKWIPFGGAETNPDEFDVISDSVKAPKIFRHTFSVQNGFQPNLNREDLPPVFKEPNRIDVTSDYVSTSDVKVKIDDSSKTEEFLYLAVFNAEEWKIVAWAKLIGGTTTFEKMGNNNIVYLPSFYKKGKVVPADKPFILTKSGKQTVQPFSIASKTMKLATYNKFFDFKWNIGYPKHGDKMELFYWDNEWKSCGICVVDERNVLSFKNVPENALLWLKSYDWENTWQRIFTVEDGEQVWN